MKLDYTKNILVSHPRSGLNWVRYCIEYASGMRTPGRAKLVTEGEPAFYRTHDVRHAKGPDTCDCMFYKERRMGRVLFGIRNMLGAPNTPLFSRMVLLLRDFNENATRADWNPSRYAANVRAYLEFTGPKHVVYYEELKHGLDPIQKLLASMGFPPLVDFDVESHRTKSLQWYDNKGIGRTKKPRVLTEAQRRALQSNMRNRVGKGFDLLLNHYC